MNIPSDQELLNELIQPLHCSNHQDATIKHHHPTHPQPGQLEVCPCVIIQLKPPTTSLIIPTDTPSNKATTTTKTASSIDTLTLAISTKVSDRPMPTVTQPTQQQPLSSTLTIKVEARSFTTRSSSKPPISSESRRNERPQTRRQVREEQSSHLTRSKDVKRKS